MDVTPGASWAKKLGATVSEGGTRGRRSDGFLLACWLSMREAHDLEFSGRDDGLTVPATEGDPPYGASM